MGDTNRYGLSRYIPAGVKREVRARSKFGCVICRSAVYDYEHISPEFNDAAAHNSDNICLLCPRCHSKVTKRQISKISVRSAYERMQTNIDVKRPFDDFLLDSRNLKVVLGSCVFEGAKTLIEIDGEAALAIEPPDDGAAFPTLSGYFSDDEGRELFRIIRNQWFGQSDSWDMTVEGKVITIRTGPGKIALKLVIDPPDKITVQHLNMRSGNAVIRLRENYLEVGRVTHDAEYCIGFPGFECYGAEVAVQVDSTEIESPALQSVEANGRKGIALKGTGVAVAVGSPRMFIKGLTIEHATKLYTKGMRFDFERGMEGERYILPPRV